MTMAEDYLAKVTFNDEEEYDEQKSEARYELRDSLTWEENNDWIEVEETIVDFYKRYAEKERIIQFTDGSHMKIRFWYGEDVDSDPAFSLVEPYQETVTKYRKIENDIS